MPEGEAVEVEQLPPRGVTGAPPADATAELRLDALQGRALATGSAVNTPLVHVKSELPVMPKPPLGVGVQEVGHPPRVAGQLPWLKVGCESSQFVTEQVCRTCVAGIIQALSLHLAVVEVLKQTPHPAFGVISHGVSCGAEVA